MERYGFTADPHTVCPRTGIGGGSGVPLVAPIVQSTTYCRDGVGDDCAHQYSRVSNPTVSVLENALGALEDAPPAACFGSGLAAETALFLAVLGQGDHVICGGSVYGGTTRLLRELLANLGIEATFVDSTDLDAVRGALRPRTRLIFVETPANPTLELTDIAGVAAIARAQGVLLAVDNTFLTAVLQQPLELGADISVYSTTKFIDGHSAALGGAIVTRDEGLLDRIRWVRKCTGAIQAPFNAWVTAQGLKTLPLRLERQCATAARIARWLDDQPGVTVVHHPSLATGAQRRLAERQHLGGDGAVVSFELAGGADAIGRALDELRLVRLVEHVGSVETLLTHPATMTHADVPPAQRAKAGLSDGLLRLSVGLESFEAITEDLGRAIDAVAREPAREPAREEVTPCAAIA